MNKDEILQILKDGSIFQDEYYKFNELDLEATALEIEFKLKNKK